MPSAARAQAPATVDPERAYTFAANQAIITIGSSYDGTVTSSGMRDLYVGAEHTTLLTGGGGYLPPTFDAYCVQIGASILRPSQAVTVGPMDSSFNLGLAAVNPGVDYGGALGWIYKNYAGSVVGQNEPAAEQTAALQLSLWEVEYNWTGTGLNGISTTLDSTDALNNPLNFYYNGNPTAISPAIVYDPIVTANIRADANTILTSWNGQTDDNAATFLNGKTSGGQGLVGPRPGVPEPATLALLAGPMVLGLLRGRRRRG